MEFGGIGIGNAPMSGRSMCQLEGIKVRSQRRQRCLGPLLVPVTTIQEASAYFTRAHIINDETLISGGFASSPLRFYQKKQNVNMTFSMYF